MAARNGISNKNLITMAMSQFHYGTILESIRDILLQIGAMNAPSVKNKYSALLENMNATS